MLQAACAPSRTLTPTPLGRSVDPHNPPLRLIWALETPGAALLIPLFLYLTQPCSLLSDEKKLLSDPPMFSRVNQLVRHLSRPLPNYAHTSAAAASASIVTPRHSSYTMTSSVTASERFRRKIHTAACLIIGDEVLGGKVCNSSVLSVH